MGNVCICRNTNFVLFMFSFCHPSQNLIVSRNRWEVNANKVSESSITSTCISKTMMLLDRQCDILNVL